MPPDPTAFGWTATDWLVTHSPYTYVNPAAPGANPVDAKKVNFIDAANLADASDPKGKAGAIFDKFTAWCPWRDGKDNNLQGDLGVWNAATDDVDGDGGPTPGDPHVDDAAEKYAYGRVAVNEEGPAAEACLAALPFVIYQSDASLSPNPVDFRAWVGGAAADVKDYYLTAIGAAGTSITEIRNALTNKRFESRKQFLDTVVLPRIGNASVPIALGPSFGRDHEDNQVYEVNPGAGLVLRRWDAARPQEWETIQRPPRTATALASAIPAMYILPGQVGDGGDFLVDDKSEIDYTVGALMNEVALENELPQEFASAAGTGIITYYITVQITDGKDVDGVDDTVPADGIGVAQPDWKEGSVLAEKRIIALVNTALPSTNPQRIRIFSWSTEGRQPQR
jgi:hypothetical protein